MLGLCPTGSRTEKARAFIDAIFRMNRALGIPERFPCIRPEDLPQMADGAEAEANPVYPVPVIFSKEDFIRVARRVMPCALAIKNEKREAAYETVLFRKLPPLAFYGFGALYSAAVGTV